MKADINTQEMNVEELLTIVESISDGVMAVNNDLQVIYFNNSAEIITGKKREAVIGMNCNTVMSVCDGDCAMIETIQSKKRMVNQYLCINRSDGKEVPISVSTALLKDKTGKIVGGVETFRDLRKRKLITHRNCYE